VLLDSFQWAAPLMCAGRLSSNRLSIAKGINPAMLLDWVSLLFCFPSVAVFYRLDLMLHHGRDVHPMWVMFMMTGTLRSLVCGSVLEY
jgi:hypothetical protein